MKKTSLLLLSGMMISVAFAGNHAKANGLFPSEVEPIEESQEYSEEKSHVLYIDGQQQTFTGKPLFDKGILYVPVPAAVKVLNEKADVSQSVSYSKLSSYDFLKEQNSISKVNGREVVRVDILQDLGIKAEWKDNPGRLHLETADHLKVDNLQIGDSMAEVDEKKDIHWNTGFGQPADYIGYYGDMHEFTYLDRYGKERSGEVPDLQLEILEGSLSYMIISSSDYETAKGITIGDSLFDVTRAYGSEYIKENMYGKTVYIYHVNGGSLWFIANEDREVERIGVWGFQLDGYHR